MSTAPLAEADWGARLLVNGASLEQGSGSGGAPRPPAEPLDAPPSTVARPAWWLARALASLERHVMQPAFGGRHTDEEECRSASESE